jgi:hypothetical protein
MSHNNDNNDNNDYDDNDNDANDDDNNWKQFTGNCITAFIYTLIFGILGSNLIFLAKIAARQGKPDCWGNKEDIDGNTLTLLDLYYPTDEETVPYKGICPPQLVDDYEQFRLGEYYPCGKEYDFKNLKMKNWWMLLMQSAGFRRVGRPYSWIDQSEGFGGKIISGIARSIMHTFISSRGAFKDAIFFFTFIPDFVLMALWWIIIPFIFGYNIILSACGGIVNGLRNSTGGSTNIIISVLLFLLLLPFLIIQPIVITFITFLFLVLSYILQPVLTDAHLIFNILRCNSKVLAMVFGFFVLIAAKKSLKTEISNPMNGVYIVIILINLVGSIY